MLRRDFEGLPLTVGEIEQLRLVVRPAERTLEKSDIDGVEEPKEVGWSRDVRTTLR